jgi:PAS domain S-box-containing protein
MKKSNNKFLLIKAISELSTLFNSELDTVLNKALKTITRAFSGNQGYIYLNSENNKLTKAFEWTNEKDNLKPIDLSDFKYSLKDLKNKEIIVIPDINNVNKESIFEAEKLAGINSKCLILLSLVSKEGKLIGSLAISVSNSYDKEILNCDAEETQLLHIITEMLVRFIERKKRDNSLRESQEKFRNSFDYAAIGMALVSLEGHWLKVNQSLCNIVGYSEEEFLTKTFQEITHPEDLDEDLNYVYKLLSGEINNYHMEKRYFHKHGHIIWILLSVSLVRNEKKEPLYFISQIQDITHHKKAQEELVKLNNELEERIKDKTSELRQTNLELEQFAYAASHDLQEPLRMVSSYVQLLERKYKDKIDEEANEFIRFSVDGTKRMKGMLEGILTYSRIGRKNRPFQKTDLNRIREKVLSNLQIALKENDVTVNSSVLPVINADESQMIQLFQNLIGNAIKYRSKEPSIISISSEFDEEKWLFSVKDNGIGIDKAYQESIFIIFNRLHSRELYPGNGLGLAICQKIVERHNGKIWCCSEPEKGSTFFFTIPL